MSKNPTRQLLWLLWLLLTVSLLAYNDVWDLDIYYHLATGRAILAQGRLLSDNIFIYTGAGQTFYPNAAWLFEICVYLLYTWGGFTALVVVKLVLLLLLFSLLWRLLRERGVAPVYSGLFLFLVALACVFRFTERPHILSHLFLAIFVYAVDRIRRQRSFPSWPLPLVMLLWANIHAGFIFGVLYLGLLFTIESVKRQPRIERVLPLSLRSNPLAIQEYRQLGLQTVLVAAASFINPTPLLIFRSLWELVNVQVVFPITEYNRPDPTLLPWFFVLVAVLLVLMLLRPHRHDPSELIPLGVFLLMACLAVRFIPDFAIVAIPWVATRLSNGPPLMLQGLNERIGRRTGLWLKGLTAAGLLIWVLVWPPGGGKREFPVQPPYEAPLTAGRFLKATHPQGRLYNSMSVCGVAMFYLHPEFLLYQTSYFQVEKATISEAYQAGKDPLAWRAFLNRWRIDIAWIDLGSEEHTAEYYPPEEWALVFFDEQSAVYLRRGTRNDALIERYEYRVANPMRFFQNPGEADVDVAHLQQGLGELQQALEWSPDSPLLHLMYGIYLREASGRSEDAVHEFNAVIRLAERLGETLTPTLAPAYFQLGELHLALKQFEAARAALTNYERLLPDDPLGYVRLAEALRRDGNPGQAEITLRRGLKKVPQSADLYYALGMLQRETGQLAEAIRQFETALRVRQDDIVILNALGVTVGMAGDLERAIGIFDDVLLQHPGNETALRNRRYARELLSQRGKP